MLNQRENYNMVEQTEAPVETLPGAGIVPESLVQIIWRSRWIVLGATVVVLTAAFVYLQKATPIYTSTSRIYVEQKGPKVLTEELGVMTQSKNYLYTQAELLTSTPIVAAALSVPGIRQMKTFDRVDNPAAYLKKTLDATVGKKDDIISISFDSPWPAEAAQVVNAVVDSYITYHASRKRTTAAEVLKILQKQSVERNKELQNKLAALLEYKKANEGLALASQSGNIILDKLQRLSDALTQAQLATIDAKTTYERTKAMMDDPAKVKEFVGSEISKYSLLAGEKTRLEAELDRLELQLANVNNQRALTADHPVVKELQDKIARIKKQLDDLYKDFARSQLALARQQYLAAKEKEDLISEYFKQQRRQAVALNEQQAQYTLLQSDYDQTKRLCELLEDRIKELNVTEDTGALNISILEVARAADKPSKPQKARIMGIALVLGLMLGGGLALLRDWLDQRLRSAEEISAILGVPVLGVVPSMSRKQSMVARGQKVHLDSDSRAAEAYRTIRTAVFFGAPKDEAKTVLVTSPAPLDGKTTLVSNLAIAMAQAGQKVLILDADFRKPMQHQIFKINGDKGLSSVLAGTTTLQEAIQPTKVKGLELLPCGPEVPNPSEMLNSETFAKTLEQLSMNKYDRVIIDSPPVMPVTDAQILAAICNVTLLVLRAERSTRKVSQQARDGLLSVGAHILGAVVNDVARKSGRYGYYSGYGYHYGYYGYGRRKRERTGDRKPAAVIEELDTNETSK